MSSRNLVLIVEDDLAMSQLLKRLFELNYQVVAKKDGMSAMHWLAKGNMPDLIITDLDMPHINGEDFVVNLKNSGYFNDIPFVVITGYLDKETKLKCLKLGVHDYFVKPFNPKDLLFSADVILKQNLKKLDVL